MTRFKFFSKLIIICIVFASSSAQADDAALSNYVNTMMNQFLSIAKDTRLNDEAKTKKVRGMLMTNLDFDWMGKFVLGRYRRGLSPAQVSDFTNVYKLYLTKTYSESVKNYKGEKIEVKGVQKISDQEYVVKTLIIKTNHDPLAVDYLVRQFGNGGGVSYKVFDVVTENVSMLNSQQAEFGGVISSSSLDKLKADLAQKSVN